MSGECELVLVLWVLVWWRWCVELRGLARRNMERWRRLEDDRIYLDVVVTPKSGEPVSGLQQQDFTVMDNKAPVAISSFRAVEGAQAQEEWWWWWTR